MDLQFLGRGSAFNPKEGNNSAYFFSNNQLFLIDCGESVFEKLIDSNLLVGVDAINLMITHTHSDHVGSMGTLIMYSYFILNKKLNIIIKKDAKYLRDIDSILTCFGCSKKMYNYVLEEEYDNIFNDFKDIRYIETSHCDELDCYGILFNTLNGIIYYSGDTREIDNVKFIIDSGKVIDKLYIDTTMDDYPGNAHLYIGILKETIPKYLRDRVYCMHFNNDQCIKKALDIGFNAVKVKRLKNDRDYE